MEAPITQPYSQVLLFSIAPTLQKQEIKIMLQNIMQAYI